MEQLIRRFLTEYENLEKDDQTQLQQKNDEIAKSNEHNELLMTKLFESNTRCESLVQQMIENSERNLQQNITMQRENQENVKKITQQHVQEMTQLKQKIDANQYGTNGTIARLRKLEEVIEQLKPVLNRPTKEEDEEIVEAKVRKEIKDHAFY